MHFIEWLYDGPRDDMIAVSQFRPYKTTRAFDTAAAAMQYAEELDGRGAEGVYFRLSTLPGGWEPQTPGGRGTAAESAWSYAIMADMDLNGPGHVSTAYPDTDEDLTRLIEKAGLPEPSAWINSGGGRYPVWKLTERVDAAAMAPVSAAWHAHMISWAKHLGWKLDNTSDVARVYRMPGTHNRKAERNGDHVLCRVTSMDGPVYPFEDLVSVLAAAETPTAEPVKPRESALGAPSLFGSPSEVRAPAAMERRKTAFTDEEGQLDLSRRVRELQEELYPGNVYRAISAFTLACLHFQSFPWMSRDVIGQQVLSAAQSLGWTELDAADWDKIDRTIERWRDGLVEDAWVATRVPDVAPSDAVDALMARMLSASEMAQKPAPEPLVWGLLDRDTVAALVGLPGSFKSFVALDLAAHIGQGREWHGRRVERGEVVYIAAEGERGMTLRVRAWEKIHGPMTGVRFLPEPVQTRDRMAWDVLVEACRRIQPAMVVVDTQSMVTLGADENDNGQMNEAMFAFKAIQRASGACVVPVHHTTKTGEGTRGAGAQDGAHDTRLKLVRQEPRSSLVVKLKDEKQKDMAETGDGLTLMLEVVPLGQDPLTGRELSSLVVAEENAFLAAAGTPEPEQWVASSLSVAEMVVQVLTDHGMERGITKPEAHQVVLERFYGGERARLNKSTWHTAWNRALTHDGVVSTGGGRFSFDPLYDSE